MNFAFDWFVLSIDEVIRAVFVWFFKLYNSITEPWTCQDAITIRTFFSCQISKTFSLKFLFDKSSKNDDRCCVKFHFEVVWGVIGVILAGRLMIITWNYENEFHHFHACMNHISYRISKYPNNLMNDRSHLRPTFSSNLIESAAAEVLPCFLLPIAITTDADVWC